jgi:hypothetical protein
MSVKQFNATYFNQDDRILLRFNTLDESEIRLWLTRFMTRYLLIAIHQLVQKNLERLHAPQVAQALQEFHEDGLKKSTNFQDTYVPATKFPLGEEAILVTGLNLSTQEDMFSIDFNLINQQNVNLKKPMAAAQSLAVLLDQLQKNSAWDIDIAAASMNPVAPTSAGMDKNKLH